MKSLFSFQNIMRMASFAMVTLSYNIVAFPYTNINRCMRQDHQQHELTKTTARQLLSGRSQYYYSNRNNSNYSHRTNSFRGVPQYLHRALYSDIEAQAAKAIETWSIEVTPFLEPNDADHVQELFQHRGDVTVHRLVGGRRNPLRLLESGGDESSSSSSPSSLSVSNGEGRRSRFILLHPDIGLDIDTAERDYCDVLRIQNVNFASSNTLPDALAKIGIPLELVGDINTAHDDVTYMVVDPTISKRIQRLLSKELVGVGISIELCDKNEFMPSGSIHEIKLNKALERRIERKKYEQGHVTFRG